MRTTIFTIMALSTVVAGPAAAWAPQQGEPERLRALEQRLREREEEMRDLRRQIEELRGDDPRVRVRAMPRVQVGPYGVVSIPNRPKFGFVFSDSGRTDGAQVMSVTPGSPAERAGLKSGDIITMFNGVRLQGRESPGQELKRQADDLEVGDTIQVEYQRGTERKTITMVAADLDPGVFGYAFGDSGFRVGFPRGAVAGGMPELLEWGRLSARWLDVELVSLDKDLGEYFGATEGVLVVRAPTDTSLSLKSGDVILTIDGRKASNPAQAMRILRSYEAGETFEIQIMRQKRRMTVSARIPARDRGFYWQHEY